MDDLEEARALLADAVGMEVTGIPEDARIGQFDPWDSLAHVRLILSLEDRLGHMLDPDEAIRIESLGDVARALTCQPSQV